MKNSEIIFLHPKHALIIAVLTGLMSATFATILIIAGINNKWIIEKNIPILGYFALFFLIIFCVLSLIFFIRRKSFKMIVLESKIISFKKFDINKRRSIFDYYFHNEWISINYNDIENLSISKTVHNKNSILLTTKSEEVFYIPFIFRNKHEVDIVIKKIQSAINQTNTNNNATSH